MDDFLVPLYQFSRFSIPGPPPPEEAPLFWRKLLGCFVWAKVLEHVYVKKMEFMKQNLDFSNEIRILSNICILGNCDVVKHQQEDASCISIDCYGDP